MRFRVFRDDRDTLFSYKNFRELRATREARRPNGSKGVNKFFFFALLRVSEHFESIETHFFFLKFS